MRLSGLVILLVAIAIPAVAAPTRWDEIVREWKRSATDQPARSRMTYKIDVEAFGTLAKNQFELEIIKTPRCLYIGRLEDSKLILVTADNPQYSMQLKLLKDQDQFSILEVKPNPTGVPRSGRPLCQATYGAGTGLVCIPALWVGLDWLANEENVSNIEIVETDEEVEIAFKLSMSQFNRGKVVLSKTHRLLPSKLELHGAGIEMTAEMVKMLKEKGVRGTNGQPVPSNIAGTKSTPPSLFVDWEFAEDGGYPYYRKMTIAGTAYPPMTLSLSSTDNNFEEDRSYLTYYGIAEPEGLPTNGKWGIFQWSLVGVCGCVVLWITYRQVKNRK